MTNPKRTADHDDTNPPQPSPNPQAKKKNKEGSSGESSSNTGSSDDEESKSHSGSNLVKRFNQAADYDHGSVAGSPELWRQSILYPTPAWKSFFKTEDKLTSYSSDDVFGEGNSIHNLARLGKVIRGLDSQASLTAAGWAALFEEAFSKTTLDHPKLPLLKTFGLRLALSMPQLTFDNAAWIGSCLRDREDTNAWTGAYLFFGSPWNTEKFRYFDQIKSKRPPSPLVHGKVTILTTPPRNPPSVTIVIDSPGSASTDTVMTGKPTAVETQPDNPLEPPTQKRLPKKVGFLSRSFFLSKPFPLPRNQPKQLFKGQERKYNTFFKIRLPKMASKELGEQETEVLSNFKTLTGKLWETDPQLLIYPWVDSMATKPLKKGGPLPTNRDVLKLYADNIYLMQGKSPWLKLRAGHTKEHEIFEDDAFRSALKELDMNFYKEKLQTKFTCRAGWLLGSHPVAFNSKNLEAAIEQLPEFKGIPIEVRMEPVRTQRSSKPTKGSKMPALIRAAHVWTSWEKSASCRKALSDLYSKRNTDGFPLGVQGRFVPYTLDNRFITTPKTAQNVERMKSKQHKFNERTSTARNFTIIGLDYICPELGMTLREVIMGLRSSMQPERNLFVAVDHMTEHSSVIFAFHQELAEEAVVIIPALPIIIEAKYGPAAWTWFNEDAKDYAAGFRWDTTKGLVSTEDARTDEIVDEWSSDEELADVAIDQPQRTEIAPFNIVLGETGKNQYNDNYSIKSFKTACDPTAKGDGLSTASATASTSLSSVISPSTSTLSNETPQEEQFTQWCQDEHFRDQAMAWLVKNMDVQESATLKNPSHATDDTNTGGTPSTKNPLNATDDTNTGGGDNE